MIDFALNTIIVLMVLFALYKLERYSSKKASDASFKYQQILSIYEQEDKGEITPLEADKRIKVVNND